MKVSKPFVNVRGQPVSGGLFVCGVALIFGFGESGSDFCALARLRNTNSTKARETRKAKPL